MSFGQMVAVLTFAAALAALLFWGILVLIAHRDMKRLRAIKQALDRPADAIRRGFPLKVESLDARMTFRTFTRWEWIGPGAPPMKHGHPHRTEWVEWVRERVFGLEPRWRDTWGFDVWKTVVKASKARLPLAYSPPDERIRSAAMDPTGPGRDGLGTYGLAFHSLQAERELTECACPLGRPLGLPHVDECPRRGLR